MESAATCRPVGGQAVHTELMDSQRKNEIPVIPGAGRYCCGFWIGSGPPTGDFGRKKSRRTTEKDMNGRKMRLENHWSRRKQNECVRERLGKEVLLIYKVA
ncbi:hypothetical protein AOLI_G00137050 [Acnodon oligacanthus]